MQPIIPWRGGVPPPGSAFAGAAIGAVAQRLGQRIGEAAADYFYNDNGEPVTRDERRAFEDQSRKRTRRDEPSSSGRDQEPAHAAPSYSDPTPSWKDTWKSSNGVTSISAHSTSSGSFILNQISQGNDINNRIGRKIRLKHLLLRADVGPLRLDSIINFHPKGRVLVYYDKQSNGAASAPQMADILDSTIGGDCTLWPLNLSNRERFVILWEWFCEERRMFSGELDVHRSFKHGMYLDCDTIYNGTAGTVSNIQSGGLGILFITNCPQTTGSVNLTVCYRTRFTD